MELIAVVIPVFNEKTYLKRCLDSLKGFPKVFVVDGKFTMFDHPSEFSDDGSLDIIKNYDNVELLQCASDEVTKRNFCLNCAKDYEWCLTLDADDYVKHDETNLEQFWEELRTMDNLGHFYGVKHYYRGNPGFLPILKRFPTEVEYYQLHTLYRIKGELLTHYPLPHIDVKNLTIVNDDIHRNDDLKWKRRNYHSSLKQYEVKLRHELHGKVIRQMKEPI